VTIAETLLQLGTLHVLHRRYADGELLFREALAIFTKQAARTASELAEALIDLASIGAAVGCTPKPSRCDASAEYSLDLHASTVIVGQALATLGTLYFKAGRISEGVTHMDEAGRGTAFPCADHPIVARLLQFRPWSAAREPAREANR